MDDPRWSEARDATGLSMVTLSILGSWVETRFYPSSFYTMLGRFRYDCMHGIDSGTKRTSPKAQVQRGPHNPDRGTIMLIILGPMGPYSNGALKFYDTGLQGYMSFSIWSHAPSTVVAILLRNLSAFLLQSATMASMHIVISMTFQHSLLPSAFSISPCWGVAEFVESYIICCRCCCWVAIFAWLARVNIG